MNDSKTTRNQILAVTQGTVDAHSRANYSQHEWETCAHLLLFAGFSRKQATAVLNSKMTRWASDRANASAENPVATAKHLAQILKENSRALKATLDNAE